MEVNSLKRIIRTTGVFLILCLNIFAVEIDIEQAKNMAGKNNPDIKKSEKDYENTALQKKEAVKYILPSLSLNSTLAKMGTNVGFPSESEFFSNSLTLTQPIYYAGKEWAGLRMAQIANKISKISLIRKERDTEIAIVEDYMNLLKAQENKKIMENSINEMRVNYNRMEELYNLKMVTKTPLLDMKTKMSELESTIISMDMAVEIAKLSLKSKLGIPFKEELVIKDVEINVTSLSAINIEEDIKFAFANKDAFKLLEYSKMIKASEKRLAMSNMLPQIAFVFKYTMQGTELGDSIDVDKSSWNAGVGINMNLWDWGITVNKMAEKDNEMKKIEIDEKMTKDSIEMAVRKYYYDIERLQKMFDAKTEALSSVKESYEIEKEKFDLKMTTASDFLTYENAMRRAEIDLVNAKIDYYVAYQKYYNFIEKEAK